MNMQLSFTLLKSLGSAYVHTLALLETINSSNIDISSFIAKMHGYVASYVRKYVCM